MKNFVERLKPSTTAKIIQSLIPRVGITSEALAKMYQYVDQCSDEIGWLGTVRQMSDRHYIVDDVYLFDQRVHATTTEITPEGLSDFATEILQQENGVELWNSMKLWGHSHVNMGITPSGQDDKQMDEFKEIGHDFMIRLIANKKGDMKLDFFHYESGIQYLDIPWEVLESDEEVDLQLQIEALQAQLNAMQTQLVDLYKEPIKEEMERKVKKFSTVISHGRHTAGNKWANQYGRHDEFGKWLLWSEHPATEEEKKMYPNLLAIQTSGQTTSGTTTGKDSTIEKKNDTWRREIQGEEEDDDLYYDYFKDDEEVLETFSTGELFQLSQCMSLGDVEDEVAYFGWEGVFTTADLERIYKMAYKVGMKYEKYRY